MEHLEAREQLNKLISATAGSEPRSFLRYFIFFSTIAAKTTKKIMKIIGTNIYFDIIFPIYSNTM